MSKPAPIPHYTDPCPRGCGFIASARTETMNTRHLAAHLIAVHALAVGELIDAGVTEISAAPTEKEGRRA